MKRLEGMYGKDFHPIMSMAKNAYTLQKIADDHSGGKVTVEQDDNDSVQVMDAALSAKLANEAWDKIAQYTESKLKPINHDITFKLKEQSTPLEKANSILDAVSDGVIPPDVGVMLIQATKHAIDIEIATEIKERLAKIEEAMGLV